jgi:hypothetical protein
MPAITQYGNPLFVEDFSPGALAKPLIPHSPSEECIEGYRRGLAPAARHESTQPFARRSDRRASADLVPICIELPAASGSVDNLLVTPNGDLALIEGKLWRNPEARREVVGQIIEYAKDLSAWTYGDLQAVISRTKAPDGEKMQSLYDAVSAKGDIDEASFIDAVSPNLRCERFLLLIIGDGIREGVASMTEFLQQCAGLHFTLAIIELALFEGPNGCCIVNLVFSRKRRTSSRVLLP